VVCHRRGFTVFAGNRLMRIGVPPIAGWLLLSPLIKMAWTTGANLSGRNTTEIPLPALFTSLFQKELMFVPQDSGGRFGLGHLRFLYYLLSLYALVLALRWLLTRSGSVEQRLQGGANRWVGRVMRSSWSIV
jgi:hypothetical protein